MNSTRRLGIICGLGAWWLAGCSDDETVPAVGDGGVTESGGVTNGTGGANRSGGSGGRSGGTGGAAGRTGTGGAQTGGRSGTGGAQAGGNAGTGGASTGGVTSTGGASGAGGGSGGSATGGAPDASTDGAPSDAGRDSEGGTTVPKACAYRCNTDADCLMGTDAAPDATYKCHPTRKRCENPIDTCSVNDDCIAFASFWFPSCTSDLDCLFPGDACVDVGGVGLCATPAPTDGGACAFPPDRVTRNRFGSSEGGTVDVCGDTSGRCDKNHCFTGCGSSGCAGGSGSTCNASSGLCECAASSECTVGACDGQSHHCECVANSDCTAPGQDSCFAGACGCASAASCPASVFKNAPPVCD